MQKRFVFIGMALSTLFLSLPAYGAYELRNGKLVDAKHLPFLSVQEHFHAGQEALSNKKWEEAIQHFRIIAIHFPGFEQHQNCFYFLGVAYYHIHDADLANRNISAYLKGPHNLTYFEEAFRYKLAIAHAFKSGAKRHLFHSEKMPCIVPSKSVALKIYDEIIACLPNHELAAQALYAKADLLRRDRQMREAIDTYQTLIRKFPRSELASNSYLKISNIYLKQEEDEAQNPDLLALAQINLKKFHSDFPKDERLEKAQQDLSEMREIYANELYETGRFYERKKQPKASILYYFTALKEYADTNAAKKCQTRLGALKSYVNELQLQPNG